MEELIGKEMKPRKLNWVEYNIYLLPFRRIVCFIKGHNWYYHEGNANSESFSRECQRCGRAEASLIINQKVRR